jgi:hypothetical protein
MGPSVAFAEKSALISPEVRPIKSKQQTNADTILMNAKPYSPFIPLTYYHIISTK